MAEFRETGLDILSESLSKYIDSQNPQVREENRRANALLQLKRNEQKLQRDALAKESQIADDEMKLKKAKGLREQTLHEQGIEDRIYKQAEDQFNVGYKSMVESGNFEDIGTYLGEYKTKNPRHKQGFLFCSGTWTRTTDTWINSPLQFY